MQDHQTDNYGYRDNREVSYREPDRVIEVTTWPDVGMGLVKTLMFVLKIAAVGSIGYFINPWFGFFVLIVVFG